MIYPSGAAEIPSNYVCKWNPDHTLAWRVRVSQSAGLQAVTSDGGVVVAQLGAYFYIDGDGKVRWTMEASPAGSLLLGADGRFHILNTTTLTSFETTALLAAGGWVTPRGDSRGSRSPRTARASALTATLLEASLHLELDSARGNSAVLLSSEDLRLWRRWGSGEPTTAWEVPRPSSGPDAPGKVVFFKAVEN